MEETVKSEVKTAGKSATWLGIVIMILGILAMLVPGLAGFSIAMVVGILVIGGGILRMIWAFRAGGVGKGIWRFALGLLTLLVGIALVSHPLFTTGLLTMVLAFYFIFDGISEIASGFAAKPVAGWGSLVFAGIVSIILGAMIWAQFPLSGTWAIGTLFGIKMLLSGMIMLTGGSALKTAASEK